jgi:cytochrome c biogenesis protein CcmG/thiol:disulfide interchange protein DsbE
MPLVEPGAKAKDFTLEGIKGEKVTLSGLKGKPSVLTFLKSTCEYCAHEAPRLAEVFKEHEGEEVNLVGVAAGNDDAKAIGSFASKHGVKIPWALDPGRKLRDALGLNIVPTLVFLDKEGNVVCAYEGSTDKLADAVDHTIAHLTKGTPLPKYDLKGSG